MALNERLQRFLAEHEIHHEPLPHHEAFTAQEVAEAAHISGRHLAKALLVREEGGGHLLLVVLPAPCRIDLAALRADAGRRKLSLASEEEITRAFPDCEVGAMSPFGHLYGLRVYVDACFPRTEEFIFICGGTTTRWFACNTGSTSDRIASFRQGVSRRVSHGRPAGEHLPQSGREPDGSLGARAHPLVVYRPAWGTRQPQEFT